jgi:hypothetical protein
MKMRYNYSTINTASSFPQVFIIIIQGSVESVFSGTGFRADAYEDVKVELTVNLTLGSLEGFCRCVDESL